MRTPCVLVLGILFAALTPDAHAECSRAKSAITAFYPIHFQTSTIEDCYTANIVTNLEDGASELGITDVRIAIDYFLVDNPDADLQFLLNNIADSGTLLMESHGPTLVGSTWYPSEVGFCAGFYETEAGRLVAYNALLANHVLESALQLYTYNDGNWLAYVIFVNGEGVSSQLAGSLDSEAIIGAYFCNSWNGRAEWGVTCTTESAGRSMFCYDWHADPTTNCKNMKKVIQTMTCDFWLQWGLPILIENSTGSVTSTAVGTTWLTLCGNRDNRLLCGRACGNWAADFLYTSASDGAVHFVVSGEEANSRYFIIAGTDTVGALDGRGDDEGDRIRCYAVPVPEDVREFAVVEVDDECKETPSGPITWSADARWAWIQRLDGQPLSALLDPEFLPVNPDTPMEPDAPPPPSPDAPRDDCEDCADVVAVAPLPYEWLGALDYAEAQVWLASGGRVRSFQLASGWWRPREALRQVVEANVAYNEVHGPVYPNDPLLIVIGDHQYFGVPEIGNDLVESCRFDSCFSVALWADLDRDLVPDAPVAYVPATTQAEAINCFTHGISWNAGTDVRDDGRILCIAGDTKAGHVGEWLWWNFDQVRQMYGESGLSLGPYLKDSECPIDERRAVGFGSINAGCRDVWVQGFETAVDVWTSFLPGYEGLADSLPCCQLITAWAPSCETGLPYYEGLHGPSVARELMFAGNRYRTRLAGACLQLNRGYDPAHTASLVVLLNELRNAPPGTPHARIVYNAVRTLQEQYPSCGLGLYWMGGYTETLDDYVAGIGESGVIDSPLSCWPGAGFSNIGFVLAAGGEVRLNVYDVTGRLVSSVKNGPLAAGGHVYSWFQRDTREVGVAPGMYFVRLEAEGEVQTAKIVIVH